MDLGLRNPIVLEIESQSGPGPRKKILGTFGMPDTEIEGSYAPSTGRIWFQIRFTKSKDMIFLVEGIVDGARMTGRTHAIGGYESSSFRAIRQ